MQPSRLTLKALWRLYNTAQDLLKSGQTADAALHFHRIAEARVRRTKGEGTAAPELENPLVTRARLGLCYCYVEQGHLERALVELEDVLGREPNNAEALCELAYILCLRGCRDDARSALERAIQHNPENAKAHKALGYFYLQEDDLDHAIEECRLAVSCDSSYDLAHVELAVALARAGRTDEAIQAMAKAVRLSPGNPDYYYSLAALLREGRRNDDASAVLERGLEIDPRNGDLLEAMSELQLEIGCPEIAVEYAQRLLRENANSLTARDVLGVAYLQLGRVNEALRIADQMVAISPLDPSHHFKKAVLFQQQGMLREAVGEFSRVAQLAPDTDMAYEARQAIESMDNHQMRQIILLASEDTLFRAKLRRDPAEAASERGFHLSEPAVAALRSLDLDGLSMHVCSVRPAMYH
jgi:tetratricopeptide (TPR) repeat protein